MTDFVRGIKAGVVAGAIYGVISGIVGQLLMYNMMESLYGYSSSMYLPSIIFSIIPGIIFGAIVGVIVGLTYAALFDKLPGSTSIVKAMVISLMLWLIFSVGFGCLTSSLYRSSFSTYYEMNIISGLILYVIFGFLLGMFWDRFKVDERRCPTCNRVVPKDALLCPYCGKNFED